MNLDPWALAFACLPWPERRSLEALDLDRARREAADRGDRLVLPSDPGAGRSMPFGSA